MHPALRPRGRGVPRRAGAPRRDAAAALHQAARAAATRATAPTTRRCSPAPRAPSRRRPPGCISRPPLLDRLAARGIDWVTVTLHVGPGTFLPVKTDDPREHRMHAERGIVAAETAARINAARRGRRAHRRGRHDQPAPPRKRRRRERRDPARSTARPGCSSCRATRFRAIDAAADQFPPAALDLADAGRGAGRARPDQGRLRARRRRALPLLLLRRRLPDREAATRQIPSPACGGGSGCGAWNRDERHRLRDPGARRRGAARASDDGAWHYRDAGLHAGRHRRDGQGDDPGRGRR